MTKLQDVVAALGLEAYAERLEAMWAPTMRTMPDQTPEFLDDRFAEAGCARLLLPADIAPLARATARAIAGDPHLRALAWYCHARLFGGAAPLSDGIEEVGGWPSIAGLQQVRPEAARLFYLIILLSGLPKLLPIMNAVHRRHRVPEAVIEATFADFARQMREYRDLEGAWGLPPFQISWMSRHLTGRLYRLGRFQMEQAHNTLRVRAFRHRASGAITALSDDGVTYNGDGQLSRPGRPRGGPDWQARLVSEGERVRGFPLRPTGCAVQTMIELSLAEWEQVLAPGDPVLKIHIPRDGPMGFDDCGASLRLATEFFGRHFADMPFAALTCSSWLLDTQLQELLSPTTNIVRFQREFYLVPAGADDKHLLESVFGRMPTDWSQAPRSTSLPIACSPAGR